MRWPRHAGMFEIILILVGIIFMIVGFFIIRSLFQQSPDMSWDMLSSVFLYIMTLGVFLLVSLAVDIKEELSMVLHENLLETRLHREATQEHLEHTKKQAGKKKD